MNLVLNLNKPENITSQQAVIMVKKIFSSKKAGHAGTLDPIATGVLLVCLNEATKITGFLSELDKEYVTCVKLGERTDTFDSTGKIIEKKQIDNIRLVDIEKVLEKFIGEIKQIPPMYSAIKLKGVPLYKLARRGEFIQRKERVVQIYNIEILDFEVPFVYIRVRCSKGTYIRSLCDDIGNALGLGAHMFSLQRTRIGKFRIEDSAGLEEITIKREALHSMDSALSHLHEIKLPQDFISKLKQGRPITFPEKEFISQYVRLKSTDDILFGIGKVRKGYLKVERLFNTENLSSSLFGII